MRWHGWLAIDNYRWLFFVIPSLLEWWSKSNYNMIIRYEILKADRRQKLKILNMLGNGVGDWSSVQCEEEYASIPFKMSGKIICFIFQLIRMNDYKPSTNKILSLHLYPFSFIQIWFYWEWGVNLVFLFCTIFFSLYVILL